MKLLNELLKNYEACGQTWSFLEHFFRWEHLYCRSFLWHHSCVLSSWIASLLADKWVWFSLRKIGVLTDETLNIFLYPKMDTTAAKLNKQNQWLFFNTSGSWVHNKFRETQTEENIAEIRLMKEEISDPRTGRKT